MLISEQITVNKTKFEMFPRSRSGSCLALVSASRSRSWSSVDVHLTVVLRSDEPLVCVFSRSSFLVFGAYMDGGFFLWHKVCRWTGADGGRKRTTDTKIITTIWFRSSSGCGEFFFSSSG